MSRIIGGSRRGQRLAMPPHDRTRPTSDRVRESAFNLIADWAGTAGEPSDRMLERFSFLDLYAGSGAVGLEAASRGAAPVVCVERDRPTAALARRNAETLGLPVTIIAAGVEAWLSDAAPTPFDVAWLDPPYAVGDDEVRRVVELVRTAGWLAPDGLVVVERSTRGAPLAWGPAFTTSWHRRYGETTLYLATQEEP